MSPDATASVEVDSVSHWFVGPSGAQPVLIDIDLRVREGEFCTIVGPSGCGKTTILNLISGVLQPSTGEVILHEDGRRTVPPVKSVGFMTARDALLPWRTAQKNVEFGLESMGLPRAERASRALTALQKVGLSHAAQLLPKQLSQGMRQRTNLARILARQPALMLMDEPFAAVDVQTKAGLQKEFGRLWATDRSTVVFVTHDLAEAALLGDRIVVMQEGRITHDIEVPFSRPRDLEELKFTGQFQEFVKSLWPLIVREVE